MKAVYFLIYILARVIKTFLWWTSISKFSRWKTKKDYIDRDINLIMFTSVTSFIWVFFGWLSALVFAFISMFAFFLFVVVLDSSEKRFRK